MDTSSLYKANGGCQWRDHEGGWEQKLPDCPGHSINPANGLPWDSQPTGLHPGCRDDICGDYGSDCCAPGSEHRECMQPGFQVVSGGRSQYAACPTDGIYQCCDLSSRQPSSRPRPPPPPAAQECTIPDTDEDLDQLFSAIPSRVTDDLGVLPEILNVSNFYLWQMVTTVNMNIDTGVSGPLIGIDSCFLSSYLCGEPGTVSRSLTTTTFVGQH